MGYCETPEVGRHAVLTRVCAISNNLLLSSNWKRVPSFVEVGRAPRGCFGNWWIGEKSEWNALSDGY
jgi:hypothetical protein